jgi:hypothetical protein
LIGAFMLSSVGSAPSVAAGAVQRASAVARPAGLAAQTPLGLDLDDVGQSAGVIFSDAMKQAAPWSSDRALALDEGGNVTRLAAGQVAQTVIYPFAAYPSGDYTLLYSGTGSIEVDPRSGSVTNVAKGRAVAHVNAQPGVGIRLRLTATDPRDYVRNVRLILPGLESSYQSQPFAPEFFARVAPFNVLRFVHWSHGDTSAVSLTWPMRSTVTQFTQAGPPGVAWEYQIALANAVGADPWFVVPAGATNFYVTQLAALVHARLDPRLHPAFEYADGAWRPGSPSNAYAVAAGRNVRLAADAQTAALAWYAQRSTQVFGLVAEVFGADAGRLVRVLGGAAALPRSAAEAVDRTILGGSNGAARADEFAVDTTGASPAAIANTRALLSGTRLALAASGGALSFTGTRDVAAATRADLDAWRSGGGGLFVAGSFDAYLAATGLLTRLSVQTQAQIDTLRAGALAAYARLSPTAHVVPRPLAAQSVLAPLTTPNSYLKESAGAAPAAATDVAAVNAGGAATGNWIADADHSGGANYAKTTTTAVSTTGITNPAPAAVYQTQRIGPVVYTIPGLTAGATYTVRLHFAELYWTSAGKRTFNVTINGTTVLSKLDVFAAAGGEFKAVVDSFSAVANASGQIVIGFVTVVDNPIVNGIEVQTPGTGPTPTPTPTPTATPSGSPADVTTYHNDNLRSGWNSSETILNTTNVASSKFGLRQILNVDGVVLAQPLFVANYPINGTRRNLLIVATEHNSVYAFDAGTGAVIWQRSLGPPQSETDVGCPDITPEYGVTSTPVIDRTAGTIYVVYATEPSAKVLVSNLGAIDLATGNNKSAPVTIGASAVQSNGSKVSFDSTHNMQRASLLLANNSLYLGVGSHCDFAHTTISGWLMRYNTSNLAQLAAYNTVEDGVASGGLQLASIWGGGFGPAADAAGNIYAVTGNGPFDGSSGGHNFGMSVLKFAPNLSSVVDYFAYANEAADSAIDADFGSGGAMLLPTVSGNYPNTLVAMGKTAEMYLLNQGSLGHFSATNSGALQALSPGTSSTKEGVWGGPAFYNGPKGPTVYYQASIAPMRAFSLATGGAKPQLSLASTNSIFAEFGGAIPAVSSNGRTAGTGIVWAIRTIRHNPNSCSIQLDAYDATNVATHLFGANAGTWSHENPNAFVAPLVANGRVYAGAYKTVYVFGLTP